MGSSEAVRIRRGEANSSAVVDGARAAADIGYSVATKGDHRVLRRASREGIVDDGFADKGEFGIGSRQPVHKFSLADNVRGALK